MRLAWLDPRLKGEDDVEGVVDPMSAVRTPTSTSTGPHSCACHRNPADARRRGERLLFSPKTWAGLDLCDKHRDEGEYVGCTERHRIAFMGWDRAAGALTSTPVGEEEKSSS
jgi:hypothetical protein